MSKKGKNEDVKVQNPGGVTDAKHARTVRSSDITARNLYTNTNKAEKFSEGAVRIAKNGVSMNEHGKNRAKKAVSRVRNPSQKNSCVSVEDSSVCKQTAASLAKKEAKVGPKTAKRTQSARIGEQADTLVQKPEAKTASPRKVWRAKVQPNRKELSARKQKSEPPSGASKQPAKTINPSPPIKPKKSIELSRKELLPENQTSQEKRIQGKQPEYETSTSESSLDSDSDCEDHIEWNGFNERDKIGVCCCLCERDVRVEPSEDYKSEYFAMMPVVAILPCGHAFHVDCLNLDDFDLKPGGEPPCVICESTMT